MPTVEQLVLAYRYLYYVESDSPIPDSVYDNLERKARAECSPESDVHKLGSSLSSDYSEEVKELARKIR